ncbi:MAG: (d)CMP kinase [Acidimicrobiia bacterium]|nr:(d)CMP kinase [Acidimicrobiia bacterium]
MTDGARRRVVAIDGPAGSGKSTIARAVAARLGLPVLDTGAMYRAITLAVLEAGADPGDPAAATRIAADAGLEMEGGVVLGGHDVASAIRGPEVTAAVSIVAAHPEVRRVLVERQRRWIDAHGGGVLEGRDIGTVVVPDAAVKVFLVASDDVRARRRQADEADARRAVTVEEMREAMAQRDALDRGRSVSPLRPADDAIVVDNSRRGIDSIADEIAARFREAAGGELEG